MSALTADEISALRWMVLVNDRDGVGLFYPTVCRLGPIEELDEIVTKGLADLRRSLLHPKRIPFDRSAGYWITQAGRAALAAIEEGEK